MHVRHSFILAALFLTATAGHAIAQRGGRGATVERPDTPTRFESQELGLAFDVLETLRLYTPVAPGRYESVLVEGKFAYLESPAIRGVSVVAKSSAGVTEADLKGYKDILDSNPPQAKLEGFKKRSVRFIKIGKNADKDALEFVYDAGSSTIRQVAFVHNGRGFTFTCTSLQAQAGSAEVDMFKPLFSRLEFR